MKMESLRTVTSPVDSEMDDCPRPDFYDFDKIRCKESFSVGQIWALYDAPDAMPRFYAQIREVFPSRFKFLVNWIVADPDGENEMEWVDSCLPIACGKFRSGNRETIFDLQCFSHQVYPVEISDRGVFRIFPRKGSTWALFRNWEIEWKSNEMPDRRYEYEFVEVLSDFDEGFGLCVAFLGKVKGFVSVFCRIAQREMLQVPPGELLRFSHMIPSCQLSGEEGVGVPKDSFELDPLSLPKDIVEEVIAVEGFGLNVGKARSSGQCTSPSPAEEMDVDEDGDFKAGLNSKGKEQVTYKENHSDDDGFVNQPKVSKGSQSSSTRDNDTESGFKEEAAKTDEQVSDAAAQNGVKEEHSPGGLTNGKKETKTNKESVEMNGYQKSSETLVDSPAEVDEGDYPVPDFNDFDKIRNRECFSVGQTWALYDTHNAMPRFYAQVRKVWSSYFKLRVTWLEADPDGMNEIEWVKADLPTSCGKFKSGNKETLSDRLSFSHQIDTVESSQRGSVKILPRKGSTWALFKNWDIKWKSHGMPAQKHEYEFVEVLADYAEGLGVPVSFLGKVKGFVSVFGRIRRDGKNTHQIPPGELLRFSHMVPSFKLTGEEGGGVPKDSFELDPLSLPKNIEEITVEGFGLNAGKAHSSGQCSSPSPAEVVAGEYSEPDFNDFVKLRKYECFSVGQTWALYDPLDAMPRFYAQIRKKWLSKWKLRVTWLEPDPDGKNEIEWVKADLPTACGKFNSGNGETISELLSFSHQIYPVESIQRDCVEILPRKGSTWALFKNWDIKWKSHGMPGQKHEYEFVEVLADYAEGLGVLVSFLGKVKGFVSVFGRISREGRNAHQIPPGELLRFSHMVPSFKLTGEEGEGVPKDSFELDPLSLPKNIEEIS